MPSTIKRFPCPGGASVLGGKRNHIEKKQSNFKEQGVVVFQID